MKCKCNVNVMKCKCNAMKCRCNEMYGNVMTCNTSFPVFCPRWFKDSGWCTSTSLAHCRVVAFTISSPYPGLWSIGVSLEAMSFICNLFSNVPRISHIERYRKWRVCIQAQKYRRHLSHHCRNIKTTPFSQFSRAIPIYLGFCHPPSKQIRNSNTVLQCKLSCSLEAAQFSIIFSMIWMSNGHQTGNFNLNKLA